MGNADLMLATILNAKSTVSGLAIAPQPRRLSKRVLADLDRA